MIVHDVLAAKGSEVVTLASTAGVAELISLLAERGIGAVVVSGDGAHIEGIVSERDVARGLHRQGSDVLGMRVSELMTSPVRTCRPGDQIRDVAKAMTDGHFRHLPVTDGDELVGIVSIGDIVKSRIDELETETEQLIGYLSSP